MSEERPGREIVHLPCRRTGKLASTAVWGNLIQSSLIVDAYIVTLSLASRLMRLSGDTGEPKIDASKGGITFKSEFRMMTEAGDHTRLSNYILTTGDIIESIQGRLISSDHISEICRLGNPEPLSYESPSFTMHSPEEPSSSVCAGAQRASIVQVYHEKFCNGG